MLLDMLSMLQAIRKPAIVAIKQLQTSIEKQTAAIEQLQATTPSTILYTARGGDKHNITWIDGTYRTERAVVMDCKDSDGRYLDARNIRNSSAPNPDGDTGGQWRACVLGVDGKDVYFVASRRC